MRIALKVDVDTYRGTLDGVPRLLELYDRYNVKATFLFSMGPDHTGRAIRRVFRPGFLSKVQRTSVTEHYGYKTLMYGVLLPGPHIGKRAGHIMRQAMRAGHEVGVHCYDHVRWQDFVAKKGEKWTQRELIRAWDSFINTLGTKPTTLGAAGWQINDHALELEARLGFKYASDVRGERPFFPELQCGEASTCLQIPTTLPTLDELIGVDGMTEGNVHQQIFELSRRLLPDGHVYTLHAELEGQKLLPVMENLLKKWKSEGDEIGTMQDFYQHLNLADVPTKKIQMREIPGRSGDLATEPGVEFR
jgi:peptidoglycan/xylan/chitin deacetylase (PgdA/CDA1 family)